MCSNLLFAISFIALRQIFHARQILTCSPTTITKHFALFFILSNLYRLSKEDSCTELELAAVRAMSAVVCCGPVFDPNGLNDDGYIYHWLDTLLSSHDDRVRF